jgi:hypothetical protein
MPDKNKKQHHKHVVEPKPSAAPEETAAPAADEKKHGKK